MRTGFLINIQYALGPGGIGYDSGSQWARGDMVVSQYWMVSYLKGSEFDLRLHLCKNLSCSQAENAITKGKELRKY
jgi:hypothetical protein